MWITWADGYALRDFVYDFSNDRDLDWPMAVMNAKNIPVTAAHMSLVESYPMTRDAIDGNYI